MQIAKSSSNAKCITISQRTLKTNPHLSISSIHTSLCFKATLLIAMNILSRVIKGSQLDTFLNYLWSLGYRYQDNNNTAYITRPFLFSEVVFMSHALCC